MEDCGTLATTLGLQAATRSMCDVCAEDGAELGALLSVSETWLGPDESGAGMLEIDMLMLRVGRWSCGSQLESGKPLLGDLPLTRTLERSEDDD